MVGHDLFRRHSGSELAQDNLDRNARALEDRRAAKNIRINGNQISGIHYCQYITISYPHPPKRIPIFSKNLAALS